MSSDDSILVLTTREREWWWSMQEVVPAFESVWTRIAQSKRADVHMLCVPLEPEIEQRLHVRATQSKHIVIMSMTPETERVALLLRQHMKVVTPMIIYLCGDATEGFHSYGAIRDLLTEHDTFVVSSRADAAATRACFPAAQIDVIPFPVVDQFKLNDPERDTRLEAARLAYVGRVSEQKNLHNLLLALWIVRTYGRGPTFTLDVYGAVDNLGSPNMGIASRDYGTYLHDLAALLGLDHMVTWHGFRPRDWLFDNVHLPPHILVSPSLHSDENFGTSVLASLVNGHQVVATAWGGHFGFRQWFPEQLTMVPVCRSTMGPVVDPAALANAILWAIDRMPTMVVKADTLDRARAAFSVRTVTSRTLKILGGPGRRPVPLERSPTLRHIDEQRALFGGTRRIFTDYQDPLVHVFFDAYGMKEPFTFHESYSYVLPPWVSYSDHVLRVDDPHRGHQSFSIDAKISNPLGVTMCPSMDSCRLPESLVATLVTQGYTFLLPPLDTAEGRGSPAMIGCPAPRPTTHS